MKNVLITGTTSYVGSSFKEWIKRQNKNDINLTTVSLRTSEWRGLDFSKYDVVIHLAAIVHSTFTSASEYYRVNRDLTIELAEKAKKEKVKQFIFFSTLSVYGIQSGRIDQYTRINPINDYGKSKVQAENYLVELKSKDFIVTIIRSPIIYGPNAPGNFMKMLNVFDHLLFLPNIKNQRSMIFVDDLSNFIYLLVIKEIEGTYIPQNIEYISTIETYITYRKLKGKKAILFPATGLNLVGRKIAVFNKVFGNLIVDQSLSLCSLEYQESNFEQTISSFVKEDNYYES